MTTAKVKAFYLVVGALLTLVILWPTLKESRRETEWGLLLSPEEVKATCGKPQQDDIYKLIYVDADRRVELQFMGFNHREYLKKVNWTLTKGGAGGINVVSRDLISQQ